MRDINFKYVYSNKSFNKLDDKLFKDIIDKPNILYSFDEGLEERWAIDDMNSIIKEKVSNKFREKESLKIR